jgi:acetolactate synthase-1/2/3 large subunit
MPTVAEQLAASLHALGVKYAFGIPGGPSIPYLEAMRQNGIEFILTANEQSAGMMADVCGRLTGIPGACHATFGPGATNLATGVGGALLDRSPLIAFTTEVKAADLGRKVQMNIDHQALYKPLTKWTTRLSAANFGETIAAAFKTATAEPPGPVHIGLPADLDGESVPAAVTAFAKAPLPPPDPAALAAAAALLQKAKKPVLAIGLTAARLGLHGPIRRFVDSHNIPVVLTPMAKGILADTHPCYAGVLFHARSDLVAAVYRQADLVVGLGYDPVEFNYEAWMPPVPLLHIDTQPADIAAGCDLAADVTGDLAAAVEYLNTLELPRYAWDLDEIAANRRKVLQALAPAGGAFTPADALAVLRDALPDGGIVTGDVGAHLHLMGQLWQVHEPNRFIMTNGWSSMGFGIPAAIGAKLCRPASPVACVTGDGGFLMNCGELLTARRLGLNVVVVVLCDRSLSLIEVKQLRKNVPPYATGLYQGEYFAADRFLGVPVLPARDQAEMRAALQTALAASGPAIIEAVVDGTGYDNLIARSYK